MSPSDPILTFASAIGQAVRKCQNLFGPLEIYESSGFFVLTVAAGPSEKRDQPRGPLPGVQRQWQSDAGHLAAGDESLGRAAGRGGLIAIAPLGPRARVWALQALP